MTLAVAILAVPVVFFPIHDGFGTAKLVYLAVLSVIAGYGLWRMNRVRIPYLVPLLAYLLAVAVSSSRVVYWYQFWLTLGTDLAGVTVMFYMANGRFDARRVLYAIAVIALVFSGFAVSLWLSPWTLYRGRPDWAWESTMGNTGFAAGMIAAMLPVVAWLTWTERRTWLWLTLALMVVHLDMTVSRTPYLSLIAVSGLALVWGLFRRRGRRLTIGLLIVGWLLLSSVIGFSLLSIHRPDSLQTRVIYWQGIGAIIADHPVLGVGRGQFQVVALPYMSAAGDPGLFFVDHAHNDYLEILSETGPLGLLGLLGVMGMALWRSLTGPPWRLAVGWAYLTLAFNALTFFPLHTVAQAVYFWAYAGLAARET